MLNEGRYMLGVNASSYRIHRYFYDDQALTFNVDAASAPGTQWPELRLGPVRPRLDWQIQTDTRQYTSVLDRDLNDGR
jgi:lipopolysaccharide transport system ATP-binding protein